MPEPERFHTMPGVYRKGTTCWIISKMTPFPQLDIIVLLSNMTDFVLKHLDKHFHICHTCSYLLTLTHLEQRRMTVPYLSHHFAFYRRPKVPTIVKKNRRSPQYNWRWSLVWPKGDAGDGWMIDIDPRVFLQSTIIHASVLWFSSSSKVSATGPFFAAPATTTKLPRDNTGYYSLEMINRAVNELPESRHMSQPTILYKMSTGVAKCRGHHASYCR